jgi:ABC-2 type transport system permease protein
MPGWLQVIAHSNPLSYEVDALRALMLAGGTSASGLGLDFVIMLITTVVLVLIGARLYPRVAR